MSKPGLKKRLIKNYDYPKCIFSNKSCIKVVTYRFNGYIRHYRSIIKF